MGEAWGDRALSTLRLRPRGLTWLLRYCGADGKLIEENVDLDILNKRLRRRAEIEHGSGGLDGGGAVVGGDDSAHRKRLETLLEGIDPNWSHNFPKYVARACARGMLGCASAHRSLLASRYDPRHWIGNWTEILNVENGSPIFNLFMSLLSSAVYRILPGEEERLRRHLKDGLKMDDEAIARLPLSYHRRMCRTTCPPPRNITRACCDIFKFFDGMVDPLSPTSMVLVPHAAKLFDKQMRYA